MNGASQIELERLYESQYKSLYIPPSEDDKTVTDKIDYHTIFFKSFTNTIWNSTGKIMLKQETPIQISYDVFGQSMLATSITYNVDSNIGFLIDTMCIYPFPKVSFKKECNGKFRFRWCSNPGPSGIYRTIMKNGDVVLDNFSGSWIRTFYNWAFQTSDVNCINESIGNTPEMCEWNKNTIEAHELRFMIPYFYSYPEDKLSGAFPVFLLGSQCNITKTLIYPSNLVDALLRVEGTTDGENWTPIDREYIHSLINVGPYNTPTLECYYGMITDAEKEHFYFEELSNGELREIKQHEYPIHQVIELGDKNPTYPGRTSTISINSSPAVAIFCDGVNIDAVKQREYSNCSTNSVEPKEGVSAISRIDFYYDKKLKFTLTPSMMKSMETFRHFPGKPQLPGYLFHAFSHRPFRTQGMVGVITGGGNSKSSKSTTDNLICTYTGTVTKKNDDISEIIDPSDIIEKALSGASFKSGKQERDDHSSQNGYWTEVFVLTHASLKFILKETTSDHRTFAIQIV